MAAPFARTLRTLRKDSPFTSNVGIIVTILLLAAWGAWFVLGRVTLVETSRAARLETTSSVHRVQAPLEGRLVEVHLEVGSVVRRGDLLVRLDDRTERLALEEARVRVGALRRQLDPLRGELGLAREAVGRARRAARGAVGEMRARQQAAATEAALAAREVQRTEVLASAGEATEQQRERARSQAEAQRSQAAAAQAATGRVRSESGANEVALLRTAEEVRREIEVVEGEIETTRASIERLEHAIELRQVLAPIGGRIGAAPELRVGNVVGVGDVIASIVPRGGLRVVADFSPEAAFGRIRRGQHARVRLAGFPWTRFGTLPATVRRVASEVRDGLVHVELTVEPARSSRIPLEHGLPGEVEVDVEQVAPVALALVSAGRLLQPDRKPEGGERSPEPTP